MDQRCARRTIVGTSEPWLESRSVASTTNPPVAVLTTTRSLYGEAATSFARLDCQKTWPARSLMRMPRSESLITSPGRTRVVS